MLTKKVRTEENIELIEEIILSQEVQPKAHHTPADIAREPNIYRRWKFLVFIQDQQKTTKFTYLNIEKHMVHARKLLTNFTHKTLQFEK